MEIDIGLLLLNQLFNSEFSKIEFHSPQTVHKKNNCGLRGSPMTTKESPYKMWIFVKFHTDWLSSIKLWTSESTFYGIVDL